MLYGADNKPMCGSDGMPVCADTIPFPGISLDITEDIYYDAADTCLGLSVYVSGINVWMSGSYDYFPAYGEYRWRPASTRWDPGWPRFTALRTPGGIYTLDVYAIMTYGEYTGPYPPTVTATLEFEHFPYYHGVNTNIEITTEECWRYSENDPECHCPEQPTWPKVGTITIDGPNHTVTIA